MSSWWGQRSQAMRIPERRRRSYIYDDFFGSVSVNRWKLMRSCINKLFASAVTSETLSLLGRTTPGAIWSVWCLLVLAVNSKCTAWLLAWGCLWSIHCLVGCFGPWVHSPQSSPIITQGDNAKVDSTRESNWMREFNSIATPCPLFKYRFLLLFTGRVYKYNLYKRCTIALLKVSLQSYGVVFYWLWK